jgi:hypothetical protein
VEVDPGRLPRWLSGFTERHGEAGVSVDGGRVRLEGADGCVAELRPPPGASTPLDLAGFVAEATRPRRLGVLLARQASVAVGLADGERLLESKVDSSYVQGRTAAGGWSQQRFARRRENQAKAAAGVAIRIVAGLLLPAADTLDALVTGGDRRTVDTILADPRLASLAALRSERFLDVAEPRRAVLEQAAVRARAVHIRIIDAEE